MGPDCAARWSSSDGRRVPSPTGRVPARPRRPAPDTFRYRNLSSGASAPATFRGTGGYWTQDGSSYLGVGPGGCSSLRQWSPATNTVSLFGPPGTWTVLPGAALPPNAAALVLGVGPLRARRRRARRRRVTPRSYVADLRRHVLAGPLLRQRRTLRPGGLPTVLAVRQPLDAGTDAAAAGGPDPGAGRGRQAALERRDAGERRPRRGAGGRAGAPCSSGRRTCRGPRSTCTSAGGTRQGHRSASAPKGWSCERRRLAAGATVADCTFAPPKDYTAVRFLDVSATNFATGAQSDTRSYRVAPAPR